MNFNIFNLFSGNGPSGYGRNDSSPPPPPITINVMRFLGIILISIFGIMLTACGDDDEPDTNKKEEDKPENTAPTIADQTFSIAENVAVDAEVGTVQATDAENDDLTFSVTAGNTGDVFAVNASSGLLTVAKALDFETTPAYTLKVSVSDGMDASTADITINVTDVNTAPTITNQTFSIAEDAAVDAEVGTVQASDEDNNNLTFSITSGNTGDAFAVNASSGLLTVAKALDFETTPTYTLKVSVSDGMASNTADVTINITDVDEAPKTGDRLPDKDIDLVTENDTPTGLWSDGTTLWVVDNFDEKIYAYMLATGASDAAKDIDLDVGNNDPNGLWSDGTTLWVVDEFDEEIYAYTLATGARDAAKEFDLHDDPDGLWSDGITLWVADSEDNKIYAYTLATGARDAAKEFNLASDNDIDFGIWSDGTTLWVVDSDDDKLYAYTLATGTRDSSKEFDLDSDNMDPYGIWSDGSTMWVADWSDEAVYAYVIETTTPVPPAAPASVPAPGTRLPVLDIDLTTDNDEPEGGIWSDGTILWVADVNDGKIYAYTLSNGVRNAARDIDLVNSNTVDIWSDGTTLWVVDENSTNDRLYAYNLADGMRDATKEFDLASSQGFSAGLWSDGTTAWVLERDSRNNELKVYAYTLATGARDADKEFDLDSNNASPRCLWSDGTTLWVTNDGFFLSNRKIYAYTLATGARDAAKDINTLEASSSLRPHGLWSDNTTLWVADYVDDKIYAYQLK